MIKVHILNRAIRVGRRSRRLLLVATLSVVALVSTSCYVYSSDQNTVVVGNVGYVFFKKVATDQIVTLHYSVHGANERTTLAYMLTWTKTQVFKDKLSAIAFYVSDFDYFFDPSQDSDFQTAMADVRYNNRCLIMHRNLNYIPLAQPDRHNWTYREDVDRHCVPGKGYV